MDAMQQLQEEIAETISLPLQFFLHDFTSEYTDEIWILLNIIYTSSVHSDLLSDRDVLKVQLEIDEQSQVIRSICKPAEFFMIWVWITKTIEKWISSAVKLDEFESAANLKKVLKLDE
jgi:hypothetical protein